ncbi:hypothetical protein B7494_g4340 [Chlorociboria aeruginascens]|nr:hypothetical protein B7494_g4340 [Chlorociboria aeruginascens]
MYPSVAIAALAWATVAYIIYRAFSSFLRSLRNAAKARALLCEEPVSQKNAYPLGIDKLLGLLAADRDKVFPVYLINCTLENGANTYKYSILGSTNLFTAEQENIQAILATQFNDFDLGPLRRGNFFPLLGNGIFTQDGHGWERSRAMIRPQFARDQVSDLDLEERHVQNLMKALDASSRTETVDLLALFFRLTLDSATEFLFGESVNSQIDSISNIKTSTTDRFSSNFSTAFDKSQKVLSTRGRFMDLYWMYSSKEFVESCKTCHNFIDHYVHLALSKGSPKKDIDEHVSGRKEKYIFLEALAAQTQDPVELRSQLLHILLAGRDTTASHLGWLFFSLARDPARYEKLRNIILKDFHNFTNWRWQGCVHVMHHRKDIWGDDAEEFKPERWEGRKSGWEYLPFNGGPRICVGQQFALTEASYVTVRLLQRFDRLENMEQDPIIRHDLTLTNCSYNGVKVKLRKALG